MNHTSLTQNSEQSPAGGSLLLSVSINQVILLIDLRKSIRPVKLFESVRASYWFVPTVMLLAACALSALTLKIDILSVDRIMSSSLIYTHGPDGARAILSAIASSMMTVAVTAFSIAIVVLQLASSQYGPRLLRNFIRDRGNQLVLGTFISTHVYCLLILRSIRQNVDAIHPDDFSGFVPHFSTTVAIILAIASIGVLIYFIDHIATSIQADKLISLVGRDFERSCDTLFPEQIGESEGDSEHSNLPPAFEREYFVLRSSRALGSGYLQILNENGLMSLASELDVVFRLCCKPGMFVVPGSVLLHAWPGYRLDPESIKRIESVFVLGSQRTGRQDIEFTVNQLVEITLRALSPGVNDPFTAMRCIDQLGAGLCYVAERQPPSPYRYDENHMLRLFVDPVTFEDLASSAIPPIRRHARSSVAVTQRLLSIIEILTERVRTSRARNWLIDQVIAVEESNQQSTLIQSDRQGIHLQCQRIIAAAEFPMKNQIANSTDGSMVK